MSKAEVVRSGRSGRASKLTPERQERFLKAIRAGLPRIRACRYAAISESTFYGWLDRARKPGHHPAYRKFAEELERVEAEMEAAIVASWRAQIPDDWRAAQKYLAMRWPEAYSERHQVEVGGTITHTLTREQILAEAAERAAYLLPEGGDDDRAE